jgi:putative membrane protein
MFLRGVEYHLAAASLIADLTVQLIAQLGFTIVGVTLLLVISPAGPLTYLALVGVALLSAILAIFIAVQRWGVGRSLASLGRRLLPEGLRGNPGRIAEFHAGLRDIYADRRQIALSMTLHVAAWFTGVAEAGVALTLMGAWPSLKVVLVLESLVFGLRTAVFFIPGAWGVQEAAYVLVGSVLGLAPETMLALILVKRARELVVGVPVLCLGQIVSALRPRG